MNHATFMKCTCSSFLSYDTRHQSTKCYVILQMSVCFTACITFLKYKRIMNILMHCFVCFLWCLACDIFFLGSMGVACHRWQKIYHKKSLLIPKPSWAGFCLVINCNSNIFITKITGSNVKMLPQRVMFLSSVTRDTMLASSYITL